jgi:hypothetical protein
MPDLWTALWNIIWIIFDFGVRFVMLSVGFFVCFATIAWVTERAVYDKHLQHKD